MGDDPNTNLSLSTPTRTPPTASSALSADMSPAWRLAWPHPLPTCPSAQAHDAPDAAPCRVDSSSCPPCTPGPEQQPPNSARRAPYPVVSGHTSSSRKASPLPGSHHSTLVPSSEASLRKGNARFSQLACLGTVCLFLLEYQLREGRDPSPPFPPQHPAW